MDVVDQLIGEVPTSKLIVWDMTYACPLRCVHCYSESGRRSSRQLKGVQLWQVVDAIIAAKPVTVVLSGGEPLIVEEIRDVMAKFYDAGINVVLYTSGWIIDEEKLQAAMDYCQTITVSLDGAVEETHDRIRGRKGSFQRALKTLAIIDEGIAGRKRRGQPCPNLTIDYVVIKSNFKELEPFCTDVVPRFAELSKVSFGAVIPTGLASRESFAAVELLTNEESMLLASGEVSRQLQAMVPSTVIIETTDNLRFQLNPDLLEMGYDIPPIQVEPDGKARAMPIYEGVVGSLIDESMEALWHKAIARWFDPFVTNNLRAATTGTLWADATRAIDLRYGTALDISRINARPTYEY